MGTKPVRARVPDSTDPGGTIHGPSKLDPEQQLIDRARKLVGPEDAEKRMFVQFDAWTDPRILTWLMAHGPALPADARKLFVDGRPPIELSVLHYGFALLTGVPLDRAVRQFAGEENPIPFGMSIEMVKLLEAKSLTVDGIIKVLAKYLHDIFSTHFPHYPTMPPSPDLKRAFIRFADGKLRISPEGREWMNAEPDGFYFFAFAEFCIQASYYNADPGADWWLKLGGMFAALQDVYCHRYHKGSSRRTTRAYGDHSYVGGKEIPEEVILSHVNSVIGREDTLEKLVERVTWNAFWYFIDDVIGVSPASTNGSATTPVAVSLVATPRLGSSQASHPRSMKVSKRGRRAESAARR